MTFILAINLSDRIYLASDTLGTKMVDGKRVPSEYCIKLIQMSNKNNTAFISCMFSGNKRFIKYLFNNLTNAFDDGTLDTDINNVISTIDEFFKNIIPLYSGPDSDKRCKIIFAGCSNISDSVKKFRFDNLSDALGPEAGHLDDAHAVHGIQFGFVNIPDQKIFSYVIDTKANMFELEKVGEMYSMIYGGSKKLDPNQEKLLIRHFLSRRDIATEGKDIVNFLRNQFTDAIGGAVTLGCIDYKKSMFYSEYELDRSGKIHDTNWSFIIDDDGPTAIDPYDKRHNLFKPFYDIPIDEIRQDLEI